MLSEENEISIEELSNYVENTEVLKLSFSLNNMKNGEYFVRIQRLNKERGSAQDIWKYLGFGANLGQDELRYLKEAAIPWMELKTVEVTDGTMEFDILLEEQEIQLFEIQYHYVM